MVVPTVHRFGSLRVVIYPNDHRPAHVHVVGSGHEAVFLLRCTSARAELRENYGFPGREVRRIIAELERRIAELCAAWERIHGSD